MRKLLLILTILITTRAHAISLSAERPISEPLLGPAAMIQYSTLVVSNGLDFLAVWYDERYADPVGTIRYTIVRADGTVESPEGKSIPIDRSWYGQISDFFPGDHPAALCRLANDYLLLTLEGRAIRIDDDGTVTEETDLRHLEPADPSWFPVGFACDGRTILSVHANPSAPAAYRYQGSVLDAELRVLTTFSIPVSRGYSRDLTLAASPAGGYLVGWGTDLSDPRNLHFLRISSEGGVLDPTPLALQTSAPVDHVRIAANEQAWVIAASEAQTPCTYVGSLSFDGTVRLPLGCVLGGGSASTPVPTPEGFLIPVTIGGDHDLALLTVPPDARSVDAAPRPFCVAPGEQGPATGASSADKTLLTWDLLFSFSTFSGEPLGGQPQSCGASLSVSAEPQDAASVATDGSGYLAAWIAESNPLLTEIRAGRLDPNGAPLDGAGVRLDTSTARKLHVDVTFDGESFVIVWREADSVCGSKVRAARVSRSGELLDARPIEISNCAGWASSVVVTSSDQLSMVLFNGAAERPQSELMVSRITRAGAVLDPGGRLLLRDVSCSDIASDGTSFLAACRTYETAKTILLSSDATITATTDVAVSGRLAWGRDRYLLAHPSSGTAAATALDRVGKPIGRETLLGTKSTTQSMDVTFDGERYVVAWEQGNRPVFPGVRIDPPLPPVPDVHLRYVTADGIPMQTGVVTVSATFYEDDTPALAGNSGRALVIYHRQAPDVTGVRRAFGRIVSPSPTRTRSAQR